MKKLFIHYTGTAISLGEGRTIDDALPLVSQATRAHESRAAEFHTLSGMVDWRYVARGRITTSRVNDEFNQDIGSVY
jgi:hypothetical protein